MKIVLMGTPVSSGNRGVLALGTSLVNLCKARTEEVILLLDHKDNRPVSFRVNGSSQLIQIVNCRLSPRSQPNAHITWIILASILYKMIPYTPLRQALSMATPWINTIEKADLIGDIRGGDSFSDIYGLKRFLFGFLMAWTVVLVKGEIVQFPQTYGPFRSALARKLARYLFKQSSIVIARDRQSQDIVRQLVGLGKEIQLCPDVAYSLEKIVPERLQMDLSNPRQATTDQRSAGSRPIGLNINGLLYNGGYTRKNMFGLKLNYAEFLPRLIKALLTEHREEIWLIPHTYGPAGSVESDPEANSLVRASLPEELLTRVHIVTGVYDCHEIKGIIGQCDFFIGSRMHSCIAALSQGIPCVGIAYSHKFAGVFETVGMQDWIVDGRDTSNNQAVERVLMLSRCRNDIRVELEQAADKAQEKLKDIFSRLLSSHNTKIANN